MKNDCIEILLLGGMNWRLRVLFTWLQFAREQGKGLYCYWPVTDHCNGRFTENFEPILGVVVDEITKPPKWLDKSIYREPYEEKFKTMVSVIHELKPVSSLGQELNKRLDILERDFIAIHVRRTDHIKGAQRNKEFTPDEEFIRFIECHRQKNLFVATDNPSTQELFLERYSSHIPFMNTIKCDPQCYRKTSLSEAVLDLFLCSYASSFLGSGFSSFSETIKVLRKSRSVLA